MKWHIATTCYVLTIVSISHFISFLLSNHSVSGLSLVPWGVLSSRVGNWRLHLTSVHMVFLWAWTHSHLVSGAPRWDQATLPPVPLELPN